MDNLNKNTRLPNVSLYSYVSGNAEPIVRLTVYITSLNPPSGGTYDSGTINLSSSVFVSGGMPDPFGTGSQSSYLYSIYATYNVGAQAASQPGNVIKKTIVKPVEIVQKGQKEQIKEEE
ncbi:MAG: hypothetical protein GY940_06295 [bacterium]|nr:hypothetical protein [bacterium]